MGSFSRLRMLALVAIVAIMAFVAFSLDADDVRAKGGKNAGCVTIQDGTIVDTVNDETITVGFDEYGYNYQAHLFNGVYSDYDRVHGGLFSDVNLQMKWNDAWLSNKDCDGDHKLDRHYGSATYIGSGAWLTNHDVGVSEDGSRWTYFVKIVAPPLDAYRIGPAYTGIWYTADGVEMGTDIWGQFAVIEQIVTGDIPQEFVDYDLPFPGNYGSPAGPGLGRW